MLLDLCPDLKPIKSKSIPGIDPFNGYSYWTWPNTACRGSDNWTKQIIAKR